MGIMIFLDLALTSVDSSLPPHPNGTSHLPLPISNPKKQISPYTISLRETWASCSGVEFTDAFSGPQ